MKTVQETIQIKRGEFDDSEDYQEVGVEARTYKGLAVHSHLRVKGAWTVTHIVSGRKLDKSREGFASEEDALAFMAFAQMFAVDWEGDLKSLITQNHRPVEGSGLNQFALQREKWKPPKKKPSSKKKDPFEDEPSIFDLF